MGTMQLTKVKLLENLLNAPNDWPVMGDKAAIVVPDKKLDSSDHQRKFSTNPKQSSLASGTDKLPASADDSSFFSPVLVLNFLLDVDQIFCRDVPLQVFRESLGGRLEVLLIGLEFKGRVRAQKLARLG